MHARALHSFHCATACIFFEALLLWGGAWLTAKERVPGRACGQGRLWEMEGVKSSVWGICQRSVLDCGGHWDEKGGRAVGVEGDRDYWGLDALTTGRMAAHHTHTHTHIPITLIASSSQAVDTHTQPSRSRMQSPMLVRLSPSPGRSACSFVFRITTERMRVWLFNLFKLLSVCNWRKTVVETKVGQVDVPRWRSVQLARCCPKQNTWHWCQ